MNWNKRYNSHTSLVKKSHEGSGHDRDLETLTGHMIAEHEFPAKNMQNLLADYAGRMDSTGETPRTPTRQVFQEILDYHDRLHAENVANEIFRDL